MIYIFIHRLGRRKHARKQPTRKVKKDRKNAYLTSNYVIKYQTNNRNNNNNNVCVQPLTSADKVALPAFNRCVHAAYRGATAADRRPYSNLSISPARRAHSSKPTATGSWNRSLTTSITTTYDDYSSVAARKQMQMQLAWSSL